MEVRGNLALVGVPPPLTGSYCFRLRTGNPSIHAGASFEFMRGDSERCEKVLHCGQAGTVARRPPPSARYRGHGGSAERRNTAYHFCPGNRDRPTRSCFSQRPAAMRWPRPKSTGATRGPGTSCASVFFASCPASSATLWFSSPFFHSSPQPDGKRSAFGQTFQSPCARQPVHRGRSRVPRTSTVPGSRPRTATQSHACPAWQAR